SEISATVGSTRVSSKAPSCAPARAKWSSASRGATERHEEEDEAVAALAGGKSLWTARVSSRSGARSGQPLELAVDTTRLHFFDPASGESIGHPLATGAEVSESASMR
ncbi:MAG: hypothetical protein ACXVW7_14315, partial [Trebonia sp.]